MVSTRRLLSIVDVSIGARQASTFDEQEQAAAAEGAADVIGG